MALVHVVLLDWTDALSGHLGALAAVVDAAEVTHSVPYIVRAVVEPASAGVVSLVNLPS